MPEAGLTCVAPRGFGTNGSLFLSIVGQAFRPAAGFLAGLGNAGRKPGGSPEGLPGKNRLTLVALWAGVTPKHA